MIFRCSESIYIQLGATLPKIQLQPKAAETGYRLRAAAPTHQHSSARAIPCFTLPRDLPSRHTGKKIHMDSVHKPNL